MNKNLENNKDKNNWESPEISDLSFVKTEGGLSANFDEGADYGTHSVP